jgi:predicted phosphate transport protein (TIGR00153 family)
MPGLFKKEVNYFDQFIRGVSFCKEASEKLLGMLADNNVDSIERDTIHNIEQEADKHVHVMFEHLNHSFITPIDRDDIIEIVKETDNVTDGIDAVATEFWLMHIDSLLPESKRMMELIAKSCGIMVIMMQELKQYKKNNKLMERIIEINNIEEEGDRIYCDTIYKLFAPGADAFYAVKWRSIIDLMENVLDACENVADTVQSIVTKAS